MEFLHVRFTLVLPTRTVPYPDRENLPGILAR